MMHNTNARVTRPAVVLKKIFACLLLVAVINSSVDIINSSYAGNLGPNLAAPTPVIDRLFLTLKEREKIDTLREHGGDAPTDAIAISEPVNQVPVDESAAKAGFLLSGVMFRADGSTVIWINGKSELSADKPMINIDNRHADRDSIEIPLQKGTEEIVMKPGQVWLPTSGKAVEAYNVDLKNLASDKTQPNDNKPDKLKLDSTKPDGASR